MYISPVVLDELASGTYPTQADCLALAQGLPLLELLPEVRDIADVYVTQSFMPKAPVRDALHLALASYYRMDVLLTWNCRHLANTNKTRHLEVLNRGMGLMVPLLATPHNLQPWEKNA